MGLGGNYHDCQAAEDREKDKPNNSRFIVYKNDKSVFFINFKPLSHLRDGIDSKEG